MVAKSDKTTNEEEPQVLDTLPEHSEEPKEAPTKPHNLRVMAADPEPTVRLSSGMSYFLSDFYAKHGTPHAEEVKHRRHPREILEGDPLVRGFIWGGPNGQQAFECRYPQEFLSEETNQAWKLACCKTYFTLEQLRYHWQMEHDGEVLPEFEA